MRGSALQSAPVAMPMAIARALSVQKLRYFILLQALRTWDQLVRSEVISYPVAWARKTNYSVTCVYVYGATKLTLCIVLTKPYPLECEMRTGPSARVFQQASAGNIDSLKRPRGDRKVKVHDHALDPQPR